MIINMELGLDFHGLLNLRTLQPTPVWINDSQIDNFTDQVQKFGDRFVFLVFTHENFAGNEQNV